VCSCKGGAVGGAVMSLERELDEPTDMLVSVSVYLSMSNCVCVLCGGQNEIRLRQ
jgi:hypothetical protein